ncbi:MAG TPA: hypothetical protein VK307_00325 [Thermoleophilaceae bacterium]|nr:hypothetical protein [Thermoleophilaceae bacterium]
MSGAGRGPVRVPVGPLVAACGAVLLVVSLFLDWYDGRTGFTVFEVIDLLLVAGALVIVAQLAGGLGLFRPAISPSVSLGVAVLTLIVVVSQIVNHPPAAVGVDKEIGIWLALAGAAVMVAGAVLASAHISLAVEPRTAASPAPPRTGAADGDRTEPLEDPPAGERST